MPLAEAAAITKGMKIMRSQQSGFTLVEIAIVLVIIGLLLGGILKGQELINSAKVKNLANDFRTIPTYIYAYQDKFKSLPGDDKAASTHITGANDPAGASAGNGSIDGVWNPDETSTAIESNLFWQHVRMANLAAGPTTPAAGFAPVNAFGGRLGVTSATTTQTVGGLAGTYLVCSDGIPGKFAKQLDIQMDDGNTAAGSMRVVAAGGNVNTVAAVATVDIVDGTNYAVCMAF
jgi:prepilin-type N-terminal cleavage/methylation domain-containing protein